jgi:hypothetical protein
VFDPDEAEDILTSVDQYFEMGEIEMSEAQANTEAPQRYINLLHLQDLLNAGLNAFAFELAAESFASVTKDRPEADYWFRLKLAPSKASRLVEIRVRWGPLADSEDAGKPEPRS